MKDGDELADLDLDLVVDVDNQGTKDKPSSESSNHRDEVVPMNGC